ncbi:MAG TPA: hypothetical protein VMW75_01810 [Thermoanaerobaculia bacterium]|nr:hypothetical protein [Thermoanaerobaculia bacterium]
MRQVPSPVTLSPPPPLPGRARPVRWLAYVWAGPTSLLGLAAALLTVSSGGRAALSQGVLEAWGGFARCLLRATPIRAQAITLGHVVLGWDRASLDRSRAHELVHVRQAERWGPLFLPAYLVASAWALLCGGHYYWDNCFERDARRGEHPSRR